MPVMEQARSFNSQFGVTTSDTTAYGVGGPDAAFAVGQTIFVRFATRIPPGSVINSATVTFQLAVKTASTAQNSSHEVRVHSSGDSPVLRAGVLEAYRPKTGVAASWVPMWPANPPDPAAVLSSIDVKTLLADLVARSDFRMGGYVTFMIRCVDENGSDMSVRLNNVYQPSPTLRVDFTPPTTNVQYTVNRCENSELNPVLETLGDTYAAFEYPGWSQNAFFGAFVDPASANAGTIARDAVFTRVPGVPTLRFTCGTPPSPNTKLTGPMAAVATKPGEWFSFAGWIYIPASTPTTDYVMVGDVYNGFQNVAGLPRGAWRPFCSPPLQNTGTADVFRWPAVGVRPYNAGYQFWISEPTFFVSTTDIRQMPFNGLTPEKPYIDHQSTSSFMQSVREWVPRRWMMVDGVLKPVSTWNKRTDVATAIVELSQPVKGGPEIQNLPAGQVVGDIPAGITVTEL